MNTETNARQKSAVYASEADILNVAMFGMTAAEWKFANKDKKGNIRDYATMNQLICLHLIMTKNAQMKIY